METLPKFRIAPVRPEDLATIITLVRELAEFERLLHEVRITAEDLHEHLFGARPYAEAAVAWAGQEPAGFALWYHNYSTFIGRPGLYLEDLYVRPVYRGQGYGEALLQHLAALAVERGCARLEWSVLDWNQRAIGFYKKLGAVPMDEWTVYRVTGEALLALSRVSGRGPTQSG
jgi:ribosomal protein S18 acetylase RimI-like enzyme